MKKLYATAVLAFVAITMNAQQDSTYVRMSFNDNPWNLPVSAMKGWSNYADENGCLRDTHTFALDVDGEELQMVLTPTDYRQTDYDNAMVRGEDPDDGDKVKTILMTRIGSTMTFIAPPSKWFAKVAFNTYRRWSSGSLYSGDATNNMHVWGKDSVQVRYQTSAGVEYELPCWSGDSVEWSLPECTGQTYLHYIDFWLLPRPVDAGISEQKVEGKAAEVMTLDGMLLRRDGQVDGLKKGIYIVGGKKKVVK